VSVIYYGFKFIYVLPGHMLGLFLW